MSLLFTIVWLCQQLPLAGFNILGGASPTNTQASPPTIYQLLDRTQLPLPVCTTVTVFMPVANIIHTYSLAYMQTLSQFIPHFMCPKRTAFVNVPFNWLHHRLAHVSSQWQSIYS